MTKKGFTLIELLVVIAIIGILIAVGAVSYLTAQKQSRDSRRKADLEQVRQALETYRSEIGHYPTTAGGGTGALDPDYITLVPADPGSAASPYVYTPAGGTTPITYSLCATIEHPTSTSYCVTQP